MPIKEGGNKGRERGKEDVYVNVHLRKEGQPERKKTDRAGGYDTNWTQKKLL